MIMASRSVFALSSWRTLAFRRTGWSSTSLAESGQADSEPGDAFVARVANYFHTLLDQDGQGNGGAEELARRVRAGNSAITVHPRLDYEFESVRAILHRNKPVAVEEIR